MSGWGQPEPWRCDECGATGSDNGAPDACPSCGTHESCMPLTARERIERAQREDELKRERRPP